VDAQERFDDIGAGMNEREREIAFLLRLAGPRPRPPAVRAARVRAAVHAEWRQAVRDTSRRRFRGWITGSLAVAATLVLVVAGASWLRARLAGLPAAGSVLAAHVARTIGDVRMRPHGKTIRVGEAIETGPTGRAALLLTRGASVRLDHDTRLVFESQTVMRLERGALYVDSDARRDGASALRVLTPLGPVHDIGTQFEVRLRDDILDIQVREGFVAFDDARTSQDPVAADAAGALIVRRGEAVSLARDRPPARRAIATYGEAWDWILHLSSPFELEGRTLPELLDWAAREQGWRWQFADGTTARRAREVVLHGSIEGLTPGEAIDAVLPTCGMTSHLDRDLLTIRAAGARAPRDE
jgi:hypothetical protein